MTRIGIAGAGGRMGKMLINRVIDYPNLELTAAIECEDSPLVGLDPGTSWWNRRIGVFSCLRYRNCSRFF
jgi:4-hydroxy-tetrahydrodipicolinate reductase